MENKDNRLVFLKTRSGRAEEMMGKGEKEEGKGNHKCFYKANLSEASY